MEGEISMKSADRHVQAQGNIWCEVLGTAGGKAAEVVGGRGWLRGRLSAGGFR